MKNYINVSAVNLQANCRLLRQTVGPQIKILACVKANGYGHGLVEAAQAFLQAGADFLGVAHVPEGQKLRQAGIQVPILLLSNVLPSQLVQVVEWQLIPSIILPTQVRDLAELAPPGYPVQVNVDSGMGRAGLLPAAARELCQYIQQSGLQLQGVYSHLATSDEADLSYARLQIERFKDFYEAIQQDGLHPGFCHIANSGALLHLPESYRSPFNMVRPGIMLYGLHPSPTLTPKPLRPALEVVSCISQIREIPTDSCLGYGCTYKVPQDMTIGIVPVGYGDGYLRSFSNQASMLVQGRACRVLGRVSMDQTIIDLTGLEAKIGDKVIVYSNDPQACNSVEKLAQMAGTIPYELTCLLGTRLERFLT